MECGIALQTSEVKSLSEKKCDLSSAHVQIVNNEAMLMDAHIPEHAGCLPFHVHLPTRPRKLLLHKKEIRKLDEFLSAADADVLASKFRVGDTGWIKLDIALCKRKKAADSREADQTRMWNRERTNFLKNG
jgi:SsrA-binding protein